MSTIKLYLADVNYNQILPIDISNGSILELKIVQSINNARELTIRVNTYLDEAYDFLLQPETNLVLDIDGQLIGFSKDNNLITHLLPYATTGAGSDYQTIVKVTSNVDNEYLADYEGRLAYYLKLPNTLSKKYYRIKPFTFSNAAPDLSQGVEQYEARLINDANNYLATQKDKNSINKQIKRQNGVVDLVFYSSSFNLNFSKRNVLANLDYKGTLSDLTNQIDPDFFFDIVGENTIVNLNTGMYSNFELLGEIQKNPFISWREIGLVNTAEGYKTKIEIGNFDSIPARYTASNYDIDDVFDINRIKITKVTDYFPTLQVELDIDFFILEGEKVNIEYKEYQENLNGSKQKIFDFKKVQILNTLEINLLQVV